MYSESDCSSLDFHSCGIVAADRCSVCRFDLNGAAGFDCGFGAFDCVCSLLLLKMNLLIVDDCCHYYSLLLIIFSLEGFFYLLFSNEISKLLSLNFNKNNKIR